MKNRHLLGFVVITTLCAACASTGIDRADKETTVNITYATVTNVETVKFKSDVRKNTAIGGLWGLAAGAVADGGEGAVVGAAAGALLSGLTTKISEGSSEGFSYTMMRKDHSEFKVITDDKHLKAGDCVAVESGRTTNLRKVSPVMCEPPLDHPVEAELHGKHLEDAAECHAAKLELLKAETQSQVDAALKKVHVLCY